MPERVASVVVHHSAPKRPGLLRRVTHRVRGLWFAHNSGRFDRPSGLWRTALLWLTDRAALVTGTEAAGRDPELFKRTLARPGWSYAHLSGAAEGECYAAWDAGVLDLIGKPYAHKLTDLTWVRSPEYGGKRAAKVHALVLRLRVKASGRKVWVVVVHMPLDNTEARARCWVDCCDGLATLRGTLHHRDPDAELVVVMDGNKNLRLPTEAGMVRQHLEKPLGLVTCWEDGLPRTGGTHDRQVIDYALLRRPLLAGAQLLRDLPDSDHRAFRYRVNL